MLSSLFPVAHARYASLPVLGEVWEGLCAWLQQMGYPRDAIRRRVQGGPLLESALHRRRVRSLGQLTEAELRSLVGRPRRWTEELAYSLARSLAEYLAPQGGLARAPLTVVGERVAAYRGYLERVRGLAPATVERHCSRAAEFLHFLGVDREPGRVSALQGRDIEAFISHAGRHLGRVSMQDVAAALRSFLRFMAMECAVPSGLECHVDSPRCFRGERLPRAVSWGAVQALLRSVERSRAKGRRDYAILLLVATYGLRASEIAALRLDDVSWRLGQIRVPRPKVGTPLLLPLTDEVAAALIAYVQRGRGSSRHRELFLRARAPSGPIRASAVGDLFDAWAARAGIRLPSGGGGPHALRHAVAMHLLRQGTPLKTIGDLLGHRSAESTCVYLRLQVEDLRGVALPLPLPATLEGRP